MMERDDSSPIVFSDMLSNSSMRPRIGYVIHILCTRGSLSFTLHDTRYNVSPGDYVILPNGMLVSEVSQSVDCHLIVMSFEESFVGQTTFRNDYGIIGQLSLMQNPVMRLTQEDFRKCREDMLRLRERSNDRGHLFREEMLATLLKAHILDLYDIHARGVSPAVVSSRPATLMRDFISMLLSGNHLHTRNLDYYADRLCITPHYLSEISKRISGQPASYWIDRFLTEAVISLLLQPELTLEMIAHRLNFSSVSYLSRYVKSKLGITPSDYRRFSNMT